MKILILIASIAMAPAAYKSALAFDTNGSWWIHQNKDQKVYFLAGEEDCYRYSVQKNPAFPDEKEDNVLSKVDDYYEENSDRLPEDVLPLFRRFIHYHDTPTDFEKTSNEYGVRHGELNGDYLANLNYAERLAFIRGYISCKMTYLKFSPSHTLEQYEKLVSSRFGVESIYPTNGDQISAKVEGDTPIADVIDRIH